MDDPEDRPVVESGRTPVETAETTVGGVLLAAGESSRFGEENKLLRTLDGDPVVVHALRTLLDSVLDRVIVVVGHEADYVRATLDGFDVGVVYNPDYERGQSTSVQTGVEAARERGWGAAVFALGDMPLVSPRSIDRLVAAYHDGIADVLPAAFEGRRGNPVLFDARHFDALADLSGDRGGRALICEGNDVALIETGDPGVRRDIDVPGDLRDIEPD